MSVVGVSAVAVSAVADGSACCVVSAGPDACRDCWGWGLNQNIQPNMIAATRMVAMMTLRWSSGAGWSRSGEATGAKGIDEGEQVPAGSTKASTYRRV